METEEKFEKHYRTTIVKIVTCFKIYHTQLYY